MDQDAFPLISEKNSRYKAKPNKGRRTLGGKINKHVIQKDGKLFCISDSGMKRIHPEVHERKEPCKKIQIRSNHRGIDST